MSVMCPQVSPVIKIFKTSIFTDLPINELIFTDYVYDT